jgi:hypothetical protein
LRSLLIHLKFKQKLRRKMFLTLLPLFAVELIVVEVEVLEANEQGEADTGQQHRPNNPWDQKVFVLGHPAEEIG